MSLAIQELERRPELHAKDVAQFISSHDFPLVEGPKVTFLYTGAADEVHLRHWIHGLPSTHPFQRLHGGPVWFLVMELPEGSRVEYKLEVVLHGQRRLVQDPLNPHLAHDPFGANSVVHAEGYVEPDWVHEDTDARKGELVEHTLHSDAFDDERELTVYLPARFRTGRRYPLLIVHDGDDYLRFAAMKAVLDNLTHRLETQSMIVALTQSRDRMREYADDERHARFLAEELVPSLEERFPLLGTPETRGLVGASFGAVASLACAWRHPGVFGNLLLQSGSFVFTDIGQHDRPPVFDPVVDFVNEFRKEPGRPAEKVYVSCGTYESMIYYNRSMSPLLQETGMSVRFTEARDGHNWENWRDRLREGLSWLFPGPLWMVYE